MFNFFRMPRREVVSCTGCEESLEFKLTESVGSLPAGGIHGNVLKH